MANQSPPPEGSEAHTISYQQMLQNMQFQNESNDVSPQENSILGNQTLISNPEIALAAISQQIIRLTFASDQFRNDRDVVWGVVTHGIFRSSGNENDAEIQNDNSSDSFPGIS